MTKKKTKFRQYIDNAEVSVENLAFSAGLSYSTCYQVVNGYTNPSKTKIDIILAYLGCKYEDIF